MKRLFEIGFWARALRNPIVLTGLAVDLAPIYGVLAWGWGAAPLVLIYWSENVITGVMKKISTLILNLTIFVRDVHNGQLITAMNADFRGNTDESWTRATGYLIRNRLLAPNYGKPQP